MAQPVTGTASAATVDCAASEGLPDAVAIGRRSRQSVRAGCRRGPAYPPRRLPVRWACPLRRCANGTTPPTAAARQVRVSGAVRSPWLRPKPPSQACPETRHTRREDVAEYRLLRVKARGRLPVHGASERALIPEAVQPRCAIRRSPPTPGTGEQHPQKRKWATMQRQRELRTTWHRDHHRRRQSGAGRL